MLKPITKIISNQLDIKLGQFMPEELDSALRKIKNRKAAGLDEIPPKVWKNREFVDMLLRHCNAVITNHNRQIDKVVHHTFPKEGWPRNSKELPRYNPYIHSVQNLGNRIETKIEKILRKNQNCFRRNRSTLSHILTIRQILECVRAKKTLDQRYYLSTSPKPLTPYTEGRWSKYFPSTASPKKPSRP